MVSRHSVDSDVEVNGRVVRQAVAELRERPDEVEAQGREILVRHGIPNPDPDAWYPLRDWLRALDEIGEAVGEDVLTAFGRNVPAGVEWPPNVDSAKKGFATVNQAYQLNHRGGEIGHYEFVETDEREQKVVCANPYPCAFDEGIIEGTLRAFGHGFSYTPMVLVHETSDCCRAEGGDRCEYRVTW